MIKRVQFITIFGHFMTHFYLLILSALLLPIAVAWKLTEKEIAGIVFLGTLTYGLGSLLGGWLVGKIGSKTCLMIYFLGSAFSSFIIGIAPDLSIFILGIISLGLFGSLYHVSGSTLLSHYTVKKGNAFGYHGAGGSAGITFSPFIAISIATFFGSKEVLAWQWVYLIATVPGILGFIFLLLDKKIPLKYSQEPEDKTSINLKELKPYIPILIIYFLIMASNGIFYRAFLTFFPTYINQKADFSSIFSFLTGGFITTLIYSTGILGQLSGGIISEKIHRIKFYIFILFMIIPLTLLIGISTSVPLVIIGIIFSLFFFPVQPIENSFLSIMIPKKLVSYVFGFKFVMTFGVGSFGAYIAGVIAEEKSLGIPSIFQIIPVFTLISLILSFFLYKLNKKHQFVTK